MIASRFGHAHNLPRAVARARPPFTPPIAPQILMSRLLLALALLTGADAYLLAPIRPAVAMRHSVTTMGVEDSVAGCLENGCSVDDVATLIGELKGARCRSPPTLPNSNSCQALWRPCLA